jgi:hypothetical protein
LKVEVLALTEDNLELMDDHAFRENMAASRTEHRLERKAINRKRRAMRDPEAELENEDLDDENYGR